MDTGRNCVIVTDDADSALRLKDSLALLYANLRVTEIIVSEHTAALTTTTADLLFLDINRPEKWHMDFAALGAIAGTVIIIAATNEFAMQALKHDVAGYIVKPIDDLALTAATDRALSRMAQQRQPPNEDATISIPNIKATEYVKEKDILYVESVSKCAVVVTVDDKLNSSYNIGAFQKILNEDMFFQVHRSYIVNLRHIKRYDASGMIQMNDDTMIPVTRQVRASFLNIFNNLTP